jgi:hypothetical protein
MAYYEEGLIQAEVNFEHEACGLDVWSFDVTIHGLSIRGTMGHIPDGPAPTLDEVLKHVRWVLQEGEESRPMNKERLEAYLEKARKNNW